jgi:heme exporter protein C
MFLWFHKLGSPPHFYRIAGKWIPWLTWIFLAFLLTGLYGGLIEAPPDYQQGESYRIIFVHVPSAWMSLLIYVVMAFCGAIVIIWHMKLAEVVLISSAPIGASFTFLALITGSLWGKPINPCGVPTGSGMRD